MTEVLQENGSFVGNCFDFNGEVYDIARLIQIINRDKKNQGYKSNTYAKWRKTEKGKVAQRKASSAYYHRNKTVKKSNNPEAQN
jgi:hypothetical protein